VKASLIFISVDKLQEKRVPRKPRRIWEDNIKADLKINGVGGYRLVSSGTGQGLVVGCCEYGTKPSCSSKGRETFE
jgi:hypothetical protein